MPSSSQPGFPLRLFTLAFAFSIFAISLGGALSWQMHLRSDNMAEKHIVLTESTDRIMLLDEVLTMSARMAAASGDLRYEQRYNQFDPQLTSAIDATRAMLPQAELARFIEETDAANNALVKIERQAFALTHRGKLQEATALLVSDEYTRLKAVYAGGMAKTNQAANVLMEQEDRQLHSLAIGLTMLNAAGAAILLAAWFLALRSARRWAAERKTAALALERANQQLETRVIERTSELQSAEHELQTAYDTIMHKNAQLQESNRVRSEFLAAMSHELKTPLNHIIGFSDLLKEGIVGPLTEEQRGFVQDIHAAGVKLLELLSNIIDFARMEAGHSQIELTPVEADAWLTESVMPWRERAAAGGLSFTLDISAPLGTLWLDAAKARQIVVSLLSNAIKFTRAVEGRYR